MWVRSLADCDASCGAKAANLARLIAAGLPVPDGFVIEDGAFRAIAGELPSEPGALGHALERAAAQLALDAAVPAALVDEVARRAAALDRLAVRSSASVEDARTGSAAGVFASVADVAPADVWPAIRSVWASALAPLAATYARGRPIAIAVIVEQFIPGERLTVYTRPAGQPRGDRVVVQRGAQVRDFARDDADPVVALALRAEHAIDARDGVDVELVETREGELWIVQARPVVHPPPVRRTPPPPALLAALVADGRRWAWDVAHNPDPLSPAQAGLVERVERAGIAPWSMRLCAGYLYTTPRVAQAPIAVADRAALDARVDSIEARLAPLLAGPPGSIDDAIDRYLAIYAIWANEVVPLIAGLRRAHAAGARPSAVEATLLAAARGEIAEAAAITRLAPLAPAWDVAVPTFGERPERVRDAIARLKMGPGPISAVAVRPDTGADELARAAADLAERDDVWFAQAQWLVRQALLARAAERGVDPDDICWVSLDDAAGDLDPDDVHRHASAARAAHARAGGWAMPLVIGGDTDESRPALHGFGSGTRISGRVVRFASLASAVAVGHGDVIVTRAITPALAVFVIGCAAIVSETGGPLDHGAAIARELGIPYVVGCRDAWSRLRDGMLVTIDGDVVAIAGEN